MEFNKTVHCSDDNGDPLRNEDGTPRLKPNWKDAAVDHMGRKHNANLHGEKAELDENGFLKMRRRDAARKPMTATNKTESFVSRFKEPGYAYRLVNDDPGRLDQFKKHDWEVVMDGSGVAQIDVGQARRPGTKAVLMRKPEEWYEEDQIKKDELLNAKLESETKPKTAEGQYGDGLKSSPLR